MHQRLFEHYLSLEGPEAGPWNRSPRSLYIEFWTRQFIMEQVQPFSGMRVCNIGIGVGGWDNFLCDWLNGKGRLTSLDIDRPICELFEYRQKREGHPNPATVVCADILRNAVPDGTFDVVTVIGSTATETKDYEGCLNACWRLVRENGYMMFMDLNERPASRFTVWARASGVQILTRSDDATARGYAFWVNKGIPGNGGT